MPWAVIHSQSCASDDEVNPTTRHLLREGFLPYNPRSFHRVVRKGSVVDVPLQLFPGYVFVSKVDDRWRLLKSAPGVHSVLMSGPESPAQISDRVVEGLRSCEDGRGLISFGASSRFAKDQPVQVRRGEFARMMGLYEGQRDRDRVSVLFSLLGCERRVFIREDNLVAAG